MSAQTNLLPVTRTDRVSDVIARDESLIEVFVRHSSHFTKLRNRSLRRIMGRLVTIDEAARIASIPAALLVRDLNDALGIAGPAMEVAEFSAVTVTDTGESGDAGLIHPPNAPIVEVDVREDLRTGREPFSKIIAAVGALRDDEVLHLCTIFEPSPLFTVLAKRGLAHESHSHAPDDWSVWFWKPDVEQAHTEQAVDANTAVDPVPRIDSAVVELDVRGLLPPEPMLRPCARAYLAA